MVHLFSGLLRSLSASFWQCPAHPSEHTELTQCSSHHHHHHLCTQRTTKTCECFQGNQQTYDGTTVFFNCQSTCFFNLSRYTSCLGMFELCYDYGLHYPLRHLPPPITGRLPPGLPPPLPLCAFPPDPPPLLSGVTWTPFFTCLAAGCLMLL